MGGQQSSTAGRNEPAPGPSKTCYYELLEVEQTASSDDIRKAYRRKALELHPDKNIDDSENATRRFAEVQTAYEILSDPQERAWYDTHRISILRGEDAHGLDHGGGVSEFRNVRITSSEELAALVGRFSANVPFTDAPTGFYGCLRETFDRLAAEETALGDHQEREPAYYPVFGAADSDYATVVKPFYSAWAGFSTRKTYSWMDKYRVTDAPDRRVRRLMEKENKKLRDDAIREFNESVRFLVNFCRKRDPRYAPNNQSDGARQKALRDAVAAQAARSRVANQQRFADTVVPEWVSMRDEASRAEVSESESEEEPEDEHIECVVCDKVFKSENQYQSHERSKKHIKALQQLQRQMRREDKAMNRQPSGQPPKSSNLSPSLSESPEPTSNNPLEQVDSDEELLVSGDDDVDGPDVASTLGDSGGQVPPDHSTPSSRSTSPSPAPDAVPATQETTNTENESRDTAPTSTGGTAKPRPEKGAKARRRKKQTREEAANKAKDSKNVCNICHEKFDSRTKLFTHIRQEGHARAGQ